VAEYEISPYREEGKCYTAKYLANKANAKLYLVMNASYARPSGVTASGTIPAITTVAFDVEEFVAWANQQGYNINLNQLYSLSLLNEDVMSVGRYDPFHVVNLPLFSTNTPSNNHHNRLISSVNTSGTPYDLPQGLAPWHRLGYYRYRYEIYQDHDGYTTVISPQGVAGTPSERHFDNAIQPTLISGQRASIGNIQYINHALSNAPAEGNILDAYGISINDTPAIVARPDSPKNVRKLFTVYDGIRYSRDIENDSSPPLKYKFGLKYPLAQRHQIVNSAIPDTFTVGIETRIDQNEWAMESVGTRPNNIAPFYRSKLVLRRLPLGASTTFIIKRLEMYSSEYEYYYYDYFYADPNTGNEVSISNNNSLPFIQVRRLLDALRSYVVSLSAHEETVVFDARVYFIKAVPLEPYEGSVGSVFNFCPTQSDGGGGTGDTGAGSSQGPDVANIYIEPLYKYGFVSDFPYWNWASPRHSYRAATKFNVVTRHHLMPRDLNDLVITDFTGQRVTFSTYEDRIVINGTPPFFVYFNPEPGQNPVPLSLPVVGEWSAVQKQLPLAGFEPENGKWIVKLGGYGERDTERAKERRDATAPYDASDYLTRISGDSVELVVPHSVSQNVLSNLTYPVYIGYSLGASENPVKYAYVTHTRLEAGQSTLKVTLNLAEPKSFFNVDISALEKGNALPRFTSNNPTELDWVRWLYKLSGMYGLLSMEPGLGFKPLSFWTDLYPDGPGMPEAEMWDRFLNLNLTSTIGEIENLLQANLCTSVERPDGGLHIVSLVPNANLTPAQFFEPSARVLFYCVNPDGVTYQRDPKLHIEALEVSVDNTFAVIEVEGYSNTVQGNLKKDYATFVQGGKETKVLEVDAGLWDNDKYRFESMWNTMKDADGNFDDPSALERALDFNKPGFRFTKLVNGVPKRVYYPEVWYRRLGMRGDDPNNLEVTTGDANYRFYLEKFLFGTLTDSAANALDVDTHYNALPEIDRPANKKQALIGFRGWGYAANICGSLFGDPFYRIRLKAPEIDTATLKIAPLVGKPSDDFAPKWFPNFYSKYIQPNLAAYPRKVKRVQNPFVGEMATPKHLMAHAQAWATQYKSPESLASHLATWLTFMEFLKTRRTTISYAGYAPWMNMQIIAVAVKPLAGTRVQFYDFYLLDNVNPEVNVGGEIWTRATGYFLFRYNKLTGEASYDPPIKDEGGVSADPWPGGTFDDTETEEDITINGFIEVQ
jgi:hypothetical protein